jgi:hypothetical protein
MQKGIEKTTLGDLSALSDLKKSMDDKAAGKAAESSEGASEE